MNLLLEGNVVAGFFDNLLKRLQLADLIIAMCFAVIGVAIAVLAKRITRTIRKRNNIEDNDKILILFKAASLVLIFVAFLILVFEIFI